MGNCKHSLVRREPAGSGKWLEWCLTCLAVKDWNWLKDYAKSIGIDPPEETGKQGYHNP